MEKSDRKRPREESEEQDEESASAPPPQYGSQEYWEDRYRRQEKACKLNEDDDEPDPFHAWYFNYEELAPLILPLILGDEGLGASIETALDNVDEKGTPSGPSNSKDDDEANTEQDDEDDQEGQNSGTKNESEEEFVDIESEDDGEDEDDGPPSRVGLAKDGPIDILEVGCGDVPLGDDLVFGISELGKSNQASDFSLEKVLKKVVCIDYSQTVIDALMRKSKAPTSSGHTRLLEYACEDARSLPYDRDSFHFLLEKGTMDAMLSEPKVGADNCRAIVSEMARVVKRRGIIMIISHINAHTDEGVDWLNDIVVPGLRKGCSSSKWSVEVHGGEIPETPEGENEEDWSANPGPAVYIIEKGEIVLPKTTTTTKDSADKEAEPPSVSLRFLSY